MHRVKFDLYSIIDYPFSLGLFRPVELRIPFYRSGLNSAYDQYRIRLDGITLHGEFKEVNKQGYVIKHHMYENGYFVDDLLNLSNEEMFLMRLKYPSDMWLFSSKEEYNAYMRDLRK